MPQLVEKYQVARCRITSYNVCYTKLLRATFDYTADILSVLPEDKVYIIDRLKPDLEKYPVVYQDFEKDICDALTRNNFV